MVKAVRGMRDILPQDARMWRHVEDTLQKVIASFAYEEIRLPLLEFTELFARGVGEATDIVEKEMYTLADRDGDSLSLRPEGTASCVRALEENGLLYNQSQRVTMQGQCSATKSPRKGVIVNSIKLAQKPLASQVPMSMQSSLPLALLVGRHWA